MPKASFHRYLNNVFHLTTFLCVMYEHVEGWRDVKVYYSSFTETISFFFFSIPIPTLRFSGPLPLPTPHFLLFLSVIYCIVSNFTASGILSYILCDGLSETPKIEVLCTFIRTPFSIKCNLGYQPCPGFKLFLNLLLRKIDWKK